MKSAKIDISATIHQIIDEVGLGEVTLYRLLAEAYGVAFKTDVKAVPLADGEEIKYILVDQKQNKILNNIKLTQPKLLKITDIFKTKCTELSNRLELARRMKALKKTGSFVNGFFESRYGEYNLIYVQTMGVYAKIKSSEFDILLLPFGDKEIVSLKLTSVDIDHKTGKIAASFSFKDKQNVYNILSVYMVGVSFAIADFIGNKVKVRLKSKPSKEFIKNVIKQSGIRIQFVWPKVVALS